MKTMLSEKRTQVYFPVDLYRRIEKQAKKESRSSASLIREAVGKYLAEAQEKEIDWENDPFFKLVGIAKSGMRDLSTNLDHYLYGAKKKPVSKGK